MSSRAIDITTGLGIDVPEGWRLLNSPLVALSAVFDGQRPPGAFVPTIVATVVDVEADETIQSFARRTTEALLSATSAGRVVNVGVWDQGDVEGREVLTTYTEGGRGVIVTSYLFVEGRLGTRIDVSFGIWDAATGVELARQICGAVSLPHTATPMPSDPEAALRDLLEGARDG